MPSSSRNARAVARRRARRSRPPASRPAPIVSIPRSAPNARSRSTASGLPDSSTLAMYSAGLAVSRSSASGTSTSSDRAGRPSSSAGRQRLQHLPLGRQLLVARLRQLARPLQPPLDRRLVGEHQLQLHRLGIVQRVDLAGRMGHAVVLEAADDQQHGVRRAHVREQLRPQPLAALGAADEPRQVDHLERRRHHLGRLGHLRQRAQPRVADVGHALARVLRHGLPAEAPHHGRHARPRQPEQPEGRHQARHRDVPGDRAQRHAGRDVARGGVRRRRPCWPPSPRPSPPTRAPATAVPRSARSRRPLTSPRGWTGTSWTSGSATSGSASAGAGRSRPTSSLTA